MDILKAILFLGSTLLPSGACLYIMSRILRSAWNEYKDGEPFMQSIGEAVGMLLLAIMFGGYGAMGIFAMAFFW